MSGKADTARTDLGGVFAAAAAGVALDAIARTMEPVVSQVSLGGLGAFMGSFGLDVAIVAASGFAAWTVGTSLMSGVPHLVHGALAGMAELRDEVAERFAARGTPEGERAAFATYEGRCAWAMERALHAAGVPHDRLEIGRLCVILGDARQMLKVSELLLSPDKALGVSMTVVAPVPLGSDAPSAIRRLSNGEAAALWTDARGTPLKTVVYDKNGRPRAVEDCSSRRISISGEDLEKLPRLSAAKEAMVAASATAAATNEACRIDGTVWKDGHVVELKDGAMTVRDASGHLDNPFGGPALVARDGTIRYALDGHVLRKDAYLNALSRRGPSPTDDEDESPSLRVA
jgi:hypothetical protein